MNNKLTITFFNILSVITAVFLILLVLSVFSVFIFTFNSAPEFTLNSVTVEKEEDLSDSDSNLYKITYSLSVSAYRFSPYSYEVKSFALKAPAELKNDPGISLYLDESLSFSNTEADEFTLTLFVKTYRDEAYILSFIKNSGFGMRGVTQKFSFFSYEPFSNLPGFYISDFENANDVITINLV